MNDMDTQLAELQPEQLQAYLASTGWTEDAQFDDGLASVWHHRDDESAEVVLPLERGVSDYLERIRSALLSIAEKDGRPIKDVLASVRGVHADYVQVRVVHQDVEGGTIPLDDGVELNRRARDMMLAAAMSSVHRKRTFIGARADVVLDYMRSLRLGQTTVGSYVVNVIAPMSRKSDDLEPQRPFARAVTENLGGALIALSNAAEAYINAPEDYRVFEQAVDLGVSSNFCDAVLGLSGEGSRRSVIVSVLPSPILEGDNAHAVVEFSERHFPALAAASIYLQGDYILEQQTIRGYVKRLDREHGQERGQISVTAVLLGKNDKHVGVTLLPDEYVEAIKAHEQELLVEVHGDILITPRTATMLHASGFRVLRHDDLFDSP